MLSDHDGDSHALCDEGSSRTRLVTAETSVVTVLPRDKIFGSTGAQLVVSMMEGIRLLDIGALTIDDVIAYREKVIRTNKAPDKDRFRRDLRKLLRNRHSSTSELASEKLTPGKAMGVEIERTENGPLETSLGQPALPTSGLERADQPSKENNPPLSFEVLSDLEIEKLEEIAEVGIPETARHVYYWDEDERIGILSVETEGHRQRILSGKRYFSAFLCVVRAGISTFQQIRIGD